MRVRWEHTCARSKASTLLVRRLFLLFCLDWTFRCVSGRKLLSPSSPPAVETGSAIAATTPSSFYESNKDVSNHNYAEKDVSPTPPLDQKAEYSNLENARQADYVFKRNSRGELKLYRIAGFKPDTKGNGLQTASALPPLRYYHPTEATQPVLDDITKDDKKYAFAYAVRPKNGYTAVSDDFNLSHKESRDGKLTMGEYKVLLPDGRLQVVRYTADGKSGFKADVTYEGEGSSTAHSHEYSEQTQPAGPIRPIAAPTPQQHHNLPSPAPPAFKFRTFSSSGVRTHPSLSPSFYYPEHKSGEVNDPHYLKQHIQHSPPNHLPQTQPNYSPQTPPSNYSPQPPPKHYSPKTPPTQSIFQKVSPARDYQKPKSLLIPTATPDYQTFKRAILESRLPEIRLQTATPAPRSIYDKINNHQTAHYAPVSWGQRAGPATHPPTDAPPHIPPFAPPAYPAVQQYNYPHKINFEPNSIDATARSPQRKASQPQKPSRFLASQNDYEEDYVSQVKNYVSSAPGPYAAAPYAQSPTPYAAAPYVQRPTPYAYPPTSFLNQPFPGETGRHEPSQYQHHLSKNGDKIEPPQSPRGSRLLPADIFRAGPVAQQDVKHPQNFPELYSNSGEQYILEEVIDDEPDISSLPPTFQIPRQSSHLPPLQFSPYNSLSPSPKPDIKSKKSTGVVYLETPATGIRPTALGVQKFLAEIPHDNFPRPKTTTHPYELGSKDYGNNVSYSPTGASPTMRLQGAGPLIGGGERATYKTVRTSFKPSQQLPPEYSLHYQAEESKISVTSSKNDTIVS